jgi:hypothetical protein
VSSKTAGGSKVGRDAKGRILPGYTGNPAGCPKRTETLERRLQDIFDEEREITVIEDGKKIKRKMPLIEALFRQYLQRASAGDRQAFRDLLDRAYGKPRQRVDLGGQDGEGIQIIINGGAGGNGNGKGKE